VDELPVEKITEFCKRWQVNEFALFGSILRDDFCLSSDIDVLITFSPQAKKGLLTLAQMREELQHLFNRDIDIVSRPALEASSNWILRNNILNSAQVIYAQR
jgi:uncharacterized protein